MTRARDSARGFAQPVEAGLIEGGDGAGGGVWGEGDGAGAAPAVATLVGGEGSAVGAMGFVRFARGLEVAGYVSNFSKIGGIGDADDNIGFPPQTATGLMGIGVRKPSTTTMPLSETW